MSYISLGNNAKITESMVMEALTMAENGDVKLVNSKYEDDKLADAISKLENSNQLSESQKLRALNNVIEKRQKFSYILYPIRKFLPKWLLKEVPMDFMDKEVKSFSFMDRLTKKIKKI